MRDDPQRKMTGHRAVSLHRDCVLVIVELKQNLISKADAKLFLKFPVQITQQETLKINCVTTKIPGLNSNIPLLLIFDLNQHDEPLMTLNQDQTGTMLGLGMAVNSGLRTIAPTIGKRRKLK